MKKKNMGWTWNRKTSKSNTYKTHLTLNIRNNARLILHIVKVISALELSTNVYDCGCFILCYIVCLCGARGNDFQKLKPVRLWTKNWKYLSRFVHMYKIVPLYFSHASGKIYIEYICDDKNTKENREQIKRTKYFCSC